MDKETLMVVLDIIATHHDENPYERVIPMLIKLLPDEDLRKFEFLLWTECQERFVAVGDVEMVSDYRNIRGE